MGSIVAIGGGDLRTLATEPIDKEIICLSGKPKPNALFIPTASSDSVEYAEAFDRAYGASYGCQTDTPVPARQSAAAPRRRVQDTMGRYNLRRRGQHAQDDATLAASGDRLSLLTDAHERGAVLCGVSAGAICWFERGHSDSMSFYKPEDWSYIAVTGMGLLPGLACPHYNGDTGGVPRRDDFHDMMRRKGGRGIAIDNDCAVVFSDDGYKVMSPQTKRPARTR